MNNPSVLEKRPAFMSADFVFCSAGASSIIFNIPPIASIRIIIDAGPLITSIRSIPISLNPSPCSSCHCWLSNLRPDKTASIRLPYKPLITGFEIATPVLIWLIPGSLANASETLNDPLSLIFFIEMDRIFQLVSLIVDERTPETTTLSNTGIVSFSCAKTEHEITTRNEIPAILQYVNRVFNGDINQLQMIVKKIGTITDPPFFGGGTKMARN